MKITDPEELAALHEATVRERVRRFTTPAEGLNIAELAELLTVARATGRATVSVQVILNMASSAAAHSMETGVRHVMRDGRRMNLVYLHSASQHAEWVSAMLGTTLPEWFLDNVEAACVVATLAEMTKEKF